MQTATRKIRLTETVSLVIESPSEQDIISAQAEALFITKVQKIVEMVSNEGASVGKRQRQYLRFTDSEAKSLIKEWEKSDKAGRTKMAESIGVDYQRLQIKVANLKTKYNKAR